jgi:hypothetical protein
MRMRALALARHMTARAHAHAGAPRPPAQAPRPRRRPEAPAQQPTKRTTYQPRNIDNNATQQANKPATRRTPYTVSALAHRPNAQCGTLAQGKARRLRVCECPAEQPRTQPRDAQIRQQTLWRITCEAKCWCEPISVAQRLSSIKSRRHCPLRPRSQASKLTEPGAQHSQRSKEVVATCHISSLCLAASSPCTPADRHGACLTRAQATICSF